MKIKILRNTVANKIAVLEGQIVDVPDAEGKYLIGIGKAVAVEVKGAKPIETADMPVQAETADVKGPKRKKAGEE